MGSALGTAWARAGHTVAFSYSRDKAKLEALARDAAQDAAAMEPNDAVRASELVLVSIPWHRLDDALGAAGGTAAFSNRIVLTCSLPMLADDSDLAIGHQSSGAEELARRLPGARIVAAFNTIPSELIAGAGARGESERAQVVICGDDTAAKDVVATLSWDAGFTPVDAGALRVSRWVEPFGLLVGQLAYAQELGPALGYQFLPELHGDVMSRDTPAGSAAVGDAPRDSTSNQI